jgi:DNA-binding CsgD family transcriptional regulator
VALNLHREARALATDSATVREAIIGELFASLDLAIPGSETLLGQLPEGRTNAIDVVRHATVDLQVAFRLGGIEGAIGRASPLLGIVKEVEDPLARTSFLYMLGGAFALTGQYKAGLKTIRRLQDEAGNYRLDFTIRVASIIRAIAEAGLRNFRIANSLLVEVITVASEDADIYSLTNAWAAEARLQVASASGVVPALRSETSRLGVAGSYAEYVASLALAAAAARDASTARRLARLARTRHVNAETAVICAWVDAIVALRGTGARRIATEAFQLTVRTGYVDTFICACRGCRDLTGMLASQDSLRTQIALILVRAGDAELANSFGLAEATRQLRQQGLSRREVQVYRLMVEGLANRAIAQRLYIAESTAKVHVRHILEKLNARSRAEAVAKWRDVLQKEN